MRGPSALRPPVPRLAAPFAAPEFPPLALTPVLVLPAHADAGLPGYCYSALHQSYLILTRTRLTIEKFLYCVE